MQAPNGVTVQVQIPAGAAPGTTFQVAMPQDESRSFAAPTTSYTHGVTVADLRALLLELEHPLSREKQVHEWSKHGFFLQKKWIRFLKHDDQGGIDDASHCARLASALLLLDKGLKTRVSVSQGSVSERTRPMQSPWRTCTAIHVPRPDVDPGVMSCTNGLAWRDVLTNRGNFVCAWADKSAWRDQLVSLGGDINAIEWEETAAEEAANDQAEHNRAVRIHNQNMSDELERIRRGY